MPSHSICSFCSCTFTSGGGVCIRPRGEVSSSLSVCVEIMTTTWVWCLHSRLGGNHFILSGIFILFHHSSFLQRGNWWSYPNILTHRLVAGLPAGVGSLYQTGPPQYVHDLSVMVDIWSRRVPGRHDKWGWAGSSLHSVPDEHHSVHGNSSSLSYLVIRDANSVLFLQ